MKRFACVTGADRGLGFDLVKELLKQGYGVFAGQYMPDWNWLAELKKEYQEQLFIIPLDISQDESVAAFAAEVQRHTNQLDLLINNAGIAGGPDNDLTIYDQLDFTWMMQVYNVNTLGPLRVSNALFPLIIRSQTKLIVNISSEAGSITRSYRKGWFAYCMSKAALNMQSTIIHNNLKEVGGQVLVIHPGWLKSFISGTFNNQADTPTDLAAKQIVGIIANYSEYGGDSPTFLDNNGNKWPW